ncbi:MAG: universal stress protein [Sandaracinaceae bacterium]
MSITQSILVATDFSPASLVGIRKAAELAREVGAKVTVCHVLDPSPLAPIAADREELRNAATKEGNLEKAVHAELDKILREHFADVSVTKTALIVSASAADGICRYAAKEDTDLIVVSTHGRTGLAHLLIGSVAERVVRHASCPVLTVRVAVE